MFGQICQYLQFGFESLVQPNPQGIQPNHYNTDLTLDSIMYAVMTQQHHSSRKLMVQYW